MDSQKIKNFKDLRIWQEAVLFAEQIYKITKEFPKDELYGIVNQMRRAAVSIPSNIAEGFMRYHNKEFKQFLFIALGSSAEIETQLIVSHKLQYITEEKLSMLSEKSDKINRMIMALVKKL